MMRDFIYITAILVVTVCAGAVLGMFIYCEANDMYFPIPALILIPLALVSAFSLLTLRERPRS